MSNNTAVARVEEYLRQRKRQNKDLGTIIHNAYTDPEAEMASLTIEDLEAVLAQAKVEQPTAQKSELMAEATAAIESLPANAVEAHHKQVITGLLALLNEAPKPEVEQEELTVYGYCVIGSDGESCLGTDVLSQQDAIDRAAEWSKDAKNLDIAYSYKVAAIVDQGGL